MLRAFGDLPIIKEPLPVDEGILIDANKRSPRNEVARFILNDLDKALESMTDGLFAYRNRLSLDAVTLFKSRVALFEASWLKNFKGTAFVPNGEGWPGKQKNIIPIMNIRWEALMMRLCISMISPLNVLRR